MFYRPSNASERLCDSHRRPQERFQSMGRLQIRHVIPSDHCSNRASPTLTAPAKRSSFDWTGASRLRSGRWLEPQDGAVLHVGGEVQEPIGAFAYFAYPLVKLEEESLSTEFQPLVVEDQPRKLHACEPAHKEVVL